MDINFDKVWHLSHIDLDGYSCQLVTKQIFKDIEFFNSNYGEEIEERLNQIVNKIRESNLKKHLILITDLNLSIKECEFLEEKINFLNYEDKNIELLLLDHHKTGMDVANQYESPNPSPV